VDDLARGEIETAHSGYLGSQDTFYVGTIKGVGRIDQQTFMDNHSKVAFVKLYTTKTPITSANLLDDRVLPLFVDMASRCCASSLVAALNTAASSNKTITSISGHERHRAHEDQRQSAQTSTYFLVTTTAPATPTAAPAHHV
jgi:hypothetical protein